MTTPRIALAGIAIATTALLCACGSDDPAQPAGTAPAVESTIATGDTMMTEDTTVDSMMTEDTKADGSMMTEDTTVDSMMTEETVAP